MGNERLSNLSILRELMIFSRQYDQPLNLIYYINCVYVLELPTLEPLFMSLLVFIVSIGVKNTNITQCHKPRLVP
jgi:hypothetical protein